MNNIQENQIQVISNQVPGTVTFSNYNELKAYLSQGLQEYKGVEYQSVSEAKEDKEVLSNIEKKLKKKKQEIEANYSAPFKEVSAQLDELINMVKEPLKIAEKYIKEREKKEKEEQIYEYARMKAECLGSHAEKIVSSKAFFRPKWLNATGEGTPKKWKEAVEEIIEKAQKEMAVINRYEPDVARLMTARYYETLSMDGMKEFVSAANEASTEKMDETEIDGGLMGYRVIKFTGNEFQMMKLMSQLDMADVEYEIIEDGMPGPMEELLTPDFDSFVAFDIETTGTFGAAKGDAPAEITEIGAVKVINGEIVDKVDWLCNPGRKIVPRIAKLTHITDEMVANESPVSEIIKKFAEYVGDLPVVGHNIKSSDLHYISSAARKAGVVFTTPFFDTYLYAKKFKEKKGWENVKLEYLSQFYGVEQESAHRAYCDAEANVGVYFKLKEEG